MRVFDSLVVAQDGNASRVAAVAEHASPMPNEIKGRGLEFSPGENLNMYRLIVLGTVYKPDVCRYPFHSIQ
jgi:hypothetical protein